MVAGLGQQEQDGIEPACSRENPEFKDCYFQTCRKNIQFYGRHCAFVPRFFDASIQRGTRAKGHIQEKECKMKKLAVLGVLLCVVTAFGFTQGSFAQNGMLIAPGSLNANVGVGMYYGYGIEIGGGVEYPIGKFVIAEKLPFTYGVAARAGVYFGTGSASAALGAFGTLHFCWGALPLPSDLAWIGNFDSYLGLGLTIIPSPYFNSIGGTSYFLSKNLALNLETGLTSTNFGVLFKF
jgi:hypothetical protein